MKEFTIDQSATDQRLDRYIGKLLPNAGKGEIQRWIRTKKIKVNRKRSEANYRLQLDECIQVFLPDAIIDGYMDKRAPLKPEKIGLDIVYEDDDILVLNKPVGLLTHPDKTEYKKTLATKAQYYLKHLMTDTFKPSSVNRLDKNTSGLVLFCKTYHALKKYNTLMRERQIIKEYVAIVSGEINKAISIKGYLLKNKETNRVRLIDREEQGAKFVHTQIEPIDFKKGFTKVKINLLTGRSHQIRVSLAHIGHPIVGDVKYGGEKLEGVTTQLLHAQVLRVNAMDFEAHSAIIEEFWHEL